jgi:hypothetical protein
MTVWILAAVIFTVVLIVVMVPHKQRHNGGACQGLWFQRRITMRGVPPEMAGYCLRHEIVHHEMHHTEKLLIIFTGLLATAAIIANRTEHPVAVFLLLGVAANIIENIVFKIFEYQADKYASKFS